MQQEDIPVRQLISEKSGPIFELKRLLGQPFWFFVLLVTVILFSLFIIFPIINLILLPEASDWLRFFTSARFRGAFQNTIIISILSTTTSTILGFAYAYAMNFVKLPGQKFFRNIVLLPLMSPPVIIGLAFLLLFGRRGYITWNLLGLNTNLYGWRGLWIVQTLTFFPVSYITITGVLKSISPRLELAARNLGSSGFHLFRTITFPLAIPGVISSALLVGIMALADFGNPMLVGGNFNVLATEAYVQATGRYDMSIAAVLSVMLVLPTLALFLFQKFKLGKTSVVKITGKPSSDLIRYPISKKVKALLFAMCSALSGFIILLYSIVVVGAFVQVLGVQHDFTLSHIRSVFIGSTALRNSWMLGFTAAVLTAVLGVLIAYLINRKNFPGRGALDFITLMPASLPGTFIGIAFILAFNSGKIVLTGTAVIIVLSMTIRNLPLGYRNSYAALQQIDESIEEASTNLGGNGFQTFTKVVMPMLKNAFSTSLIYNLMKSMNTLSAVIFLISPRWNLGSVQVLSLADHGYTGQASAMALGLMFLIFLTLGVAKLILGDSVNIFNI